MMMVTIKVLTIITWDVGVVTRGHLEVGAAQGEVAALAVQHAPAAPEPGTSVSFTNVKLDTQESSMTYI